MLLQRFEVPGLSQYSYLLGSGKQAIVIDPRRDVDVYTDFAFAKDVRITHVLETHIHADFASGATALAAQTGAELWLSGHDDGQDYEYSFPHHAFRDGDELTFGTLRLVAVHTPGHTPEHLSFLLYEKNNCGHPLALFSGDFIFVGSLGRPDLLGEAAKQALAGQLYDSAHVKVSSLPDGTLVLPGHGAGSLCGAGLAERPESTLGYERRCNIYMSQTSKPEFVRSILGSVPQFPPYYKRMKQLNAAGPQLLSGLPGTTAFDAPGLAAELKKPKTLALDVRSPAAFGGAHIPGAINIGEGQNLSLWSGWLLPYDVSLYLVGDAVTNLDEVRRSLIRVGHDNIAGYLKGGMDRWIVAGLPQAHTEQISVGDLKQVASSGGVIVDIRSPNEWRSGHIEGAIHIPGGDIPDRMHELPKDRPIHLICGSGYRSSIAASLLKRFGIHDVKNTIGGMTAWVAQSHPVQSGQ
jgi:hydroxyacylglutathione hydrolase